MINKNVNKNSKTINEINLEKQQNKKLLLEKMKKVTTQTISTPSVESKEASKISKQLKKQKEQYESKISKLEQELLKQKKLNLNLTTNIKSMKETHKQQIGDINISISNLKKENELAILNIKQENELILFNLMKESEQIKKANFDLLVRTEEINALLDEKDSVIVLANEEIKLLSNNDIAKTVIELKKELKRVAGNAKHYLLNFETQTKVYKKLKQEFGELKSEFNNKLMFEKNNIIQTERDLKLEIEKTKRDRRNLFNTFKGKKLFIILNEELNEENAFEYSYWIKLLNKNFEKIAEGMQAKQLEERDRQNKIIKEERKNWVIENSEIGYIGGDNDGNWFFYTIDNQIYEVTSSKVPELIQDIPARAVVNKDNMTANVVIYLSYEEGLQTSVEKKLNRVKPKKSEDQESGYLHFGKFTVLIVGSQSLSRYAWSGEKHGLKMILHNPFEDHESRLKDKIKQCDIAIICLKHISHTVTSIIDVKDPKVQLMEQDTEERVMARIRYTAISLGLIQFNPEIS